MGKPKPEGKWYKHGEEIIPSKEFIIENFEDGTSVLTITESYPDDTGEIVYEAENPLGVAITSTQLLIETAEGKYRSGQIMLILFYFQRMEGDSWFKIHSLSFQPCFFHFHIIYDQIIQHYFQTHLEKPL